MSGVAVLFEEGSAWKKVGREGCNFQSRTDERGVAKIPKCHLPAGDLYISR